MPFRRGPPFWRRKSCRAVGNGTPVVGIVGKTNARDLTGMGLLLKGQEGFTPKPR